MESVSGVEKFAFFMRFLAQPTPSTNTPGGASSIANGKNVFAQRWLRSVPYADALDG